MSRCAHGHYHNRNRVYSPALQRFMQRDPNATALALLTIAARHGQGAFGGLDEFDLEAMYGDGLNLYTYLGSNPWGRHDPLGLQWDPFDMVDDFLAESLGNRLATLSAIGQDSKAAGVVLATIASYLPFPAASIMGEAALRALGESTDSEMAMAMALAAVPGGKLAAVLGKATGAMWRGAMHYARIGGGAILNRGSGLMRKAREAIRRKPPGACGCFVAGTLVWTAHGMVPIEEVRVGDFVIAKDEASGALVLREVTGEIVVKQAALLDVTRQKDGHVTTLRTTDEHPFWVIGRGWTRADSLVPGDEVDTFGSTATVLALSFTGERTTVYNISVDGNPNYFVGPDGVWVHNCDVDSVFKAIWGHLSRTRRRQIMTRWDLPNDATQAKLRGMLDGQPIAVRNRDGSALFHQDGVAMIVNPDGKGTAFVNDDIYGWIARNFD